VLDACPVRSNLERFREGSVSTWPLVMCPGCKVPMGVKLVTTDSPGSVKGKVVYACVICKTETSRPYKVSEPKRRAIPPSGPSTSLKRSS
jgi:hypothetical protein